MSTEEEKEIWVFLSHSLKDFDKVRRVRNMLEEQNLRPLMFFLRCLGDNDENELESLIKREIDCRTRFILCDSPNARTSDWVKKELKYIKSKDKPYETIDLTKSDDEILRQLNEFKKKITLFFCYSCQDSNLVHSVYNRLKKYDFNTFSDMHNLPNGGDFTQALRLALDNALAKGYILFFVTENSLRSQWCKYEIEYAIKNGATKQIIPIVLTKDIPDFIESHPFLQPIHKNSISADEITDSILSHLLSTGQILTYYRNFKNGISPEFDEYEAERLGKIYYNRARKSDEENIASGVIALGLCYEEGIGVEIDLNKAYQQYQDPITTDGLATEMAKRVYFKLHPEENQTRQ
ncbi:MAG: TIR domain-containing protein [Muribaculum sp.]|nr:TIR domain-containing protein [Muribaculum sp.]